VQYQYIASITSSRLCLAKLVIASLLFAWLISLCVLHLFLCWSECLCCISPLDLEEFPGQRWPWPTHLRFKNLARGSPCWTQLSSARWSALNQDFADVALSLWCSPRSKSLCHSVKFNWKIDKSTEESEERLEPFQNRFNCRIEKKKALQLSNGCVISG
jgi:hypothetical protein